MDYQARRVIVISYIRSIFKKKEPEVYFTVFAERDYCYDCSHLQEFGYGFGKVCPACGSQDIKIVIARWERKMVNSGMVVKVINLRSEIHK